MKLQPLSARRSSAALPTRSLLSRVVAAALLSAAAPSHAAGIDQLYGGVAALEQAAERYRELAESSSWQALTSTGLLRSGSSGPSVAELRQRLAAEGYQLARQGDRYDADLVSAVKSFQGAHGLTVDGVVGPETRHALDVSPAARLRQIEATLERRRGDQSETSTAPAILVNLPEQRLVGFDAEGAESLAMRVVVGKPAWATPELQEELESMVVHPYWYVPIEILAAELAPKIIEEPSYLETNHLEVVAEPGPDAEVIDSSGIDWSAIDAEDPSTFPHLLRQKPGPDNPLGKIKFLMPNREDIYLHDTPADHLFEESERDFSHGCIRVERPIELARFVATRAENLDGAAIEEALEAGETRTFEVTPSLSVGVVYWTAWVDGEGRVHFRDDLYGRDET